MRRAGDARTAAKRGERNVRIAAPSDKRFKRAHVKPSRKRTAWARFRIRLLRAALVAVAVGYGGYRAHALVQRTNVLQVRKIIIRGNERLSNGEVLALVDAMRGSNILLVDLVEWRRRLMSSPWVGDAYLHRILPSTIDIAVVERTPVGIGRLGGELFLVDRTGVIIDEYGPNYAEFDLPIIDGLASADRGGPAIDPARAELAARVLQALRARKDLAPLVSQIDVSDVRDAVVVLEGETALLRLGEDQFAERLQSYLELSSALHEQVPAIDYVDLRFEDRVYVRPAADAKRRAATATSGSRPAPARAARAAKPG
jgi:cell division protein FtsQ